MLIKKFGKLDLNYYHFRHYVDTDFSLAIFNYYIRKISTILESWPALLPIRKNQIIMGNREFVFTDIGIGCCLIRKKLKYYIHIVNNCFVETRSSSFHNERIGYPVISCAPNILTKSMSFNRLSHGEIISKSFVFSLVLKLR